MHRSVSERSGSCGSGIGGVVGSGCGGSSSSRNRGPGLRRPSAPHMHSTPNVYHGRRRESGGSTGGGPSPTKARVGSPPTALGISGMSRVNTLSEGELLDVAILPIFQKLLTERRAHDSAAAGSSHHHHHHHHAHNHNQHHHNRASIASCPNIAVKCDIVEYL